MRRLVLLIAVLVAAPLRAEEPAPMTGDAVAGAAHYDQACARCHRDVDDLRSRLDPAPDIAAAALAEKLARHHADDATMQADIIAFLLGSE